MRESNETLKNIQTLKPDPMRSFINKGSFTKDVRKKVWFADPLSSSPDGAPFDPEDISLKKVDVGYLSR